MKKLPALVVLLLLVSCAKYDISATEDFADNRWQKGNVKSFNFTFKIGKDENADISVQFSHIADPQYTEVPLEITIQEPSGKKETLNVTLKLKDSQGRELSDCAGDVCDFTEMIKANAPITSGKYIFTVKNKFNGAYLPNALAVGIAMHFVRGENK